MYTDALKESQRQQRIREWALVLMAVITGVSLFGWKSAAQHITVDVRPGITQKETLKPGQMPPENVFNFALTLMQQIYRWKSDGKTEYSTNLDSFATYLTDSCMATLRKDYALRAQLGELGGRARRWEPLTGGYFAPERVQALDGRTWVVTLDASIVETVNTQPVKDGDFRYGVFVRAIDSDRDVNPFGLQMDCFTTGSPSPLEKKTP